MRIYEVVTGTGAVFFTAASPRSTAWVQARKARRNQAIWTQVHDLRRMGENQVPFPLCVQFGEIDHVIRHDG